VLVHRIPPLALALLLAGPPGLGGTAPAQPADPPIPAVVVVGSIVRLEYTLTDDAGRMLDSNVGSEPLIYTQGERQLVPGLEAALSGMRVGEEKKISVKPEDGYGAIDPEAEAEVPKASIPPDALAVGTRLVARSPDGDTRIVRVKEIRAETVVIDLNHPLAGMVLHFSVKILRVDPPAAR
jgi:FKBP-type peptidyl-prolyl cis-trans isomerase SlyD